VAAGRRIAWIIAALASAPLARAEYGFPISSPYEATVFGTPPEARARVGDDVELEVRSLRIFPERAVPEVLWASRELEYSVALQREPAPLVFVLSGTGARFNSGKNVYLQKVLYGAGLSVVGLSSPTHPDFIVAGSRSSVPGVMADDVRDLYAAMQRIREELGVRAQITGFYLVGWSLGGTQAAFLGQLDEAERAIGFEKILLINPAVSLYTAIQRLDQLVVTQLPGGGPQLERMVDEMLSRVALYLNEAGRPPLDSELLYQLDRVLALGEAELQALIGVAFRLSLAGMLFTSDVMTDSRRLVEPGTELAVGTPLLPYLKAGARWTFSDYLDDYLLPYRASRDEPLTRDALIRADSLYPIQDYLRRSAKIAVITNADDLILDGLEIEFLRRVFGERATIFPTGGHLGNLMYRENVERMLAFFRDPLPPTARATAGEPIPAPPIHASGPVLPAFRRLSPSEASEIAGLLDESDPLEPVNRRIYRFNDAADRWVLLPAVRGYRFVVPRIARTAIHNVFETLDEVTTLVNTFLQFRPRASAQTLGRIGVNLTMGVAGLWDAATWLGMPDHDEDFGQTLGVWGVGTGPYLVVPLLGPGSLRDLPGRIVDAIPFVIADVPPLYVRPLEALDARDANPFRYGEVGVPFEYLTVRFLVMERERLRTAERSHR
jgi:ABC-type transporter lipoprotein component MlaA